MHKMYCNKNANFFQVQLPSYFHRVSKYFPYLILKKCIFELLYIKKRSWNFAHLSIQLNEVLTIGFVLFYERFLKISNFYKI